MHVVSDLRAPIVGASVTAALRWSGGDHTWRWGGDIPTDACERVGTIQWVVPDAPGEVSLSLACDWPGGTVENEYTSAITSA